MKLVAFGVALVLLLTCSFGGHAHVAAPLRVALPYKTIEAMQNLNSVGDILSDCSELMHAARITYSRES